MKNLKEKLWEIVTGEKHNYLGETLDDKELENGLFKILEYLIEERKTSFRLVRSRSVDKLLYHLNGIKNIIGRKNDSEENELRLNKNVERIFMEGDISDARDYFKDIIMNGEEWINIIKKVYGELYNERIGVKEDMNFWIEYKNRLSKIRNFYFSEEKEFLCNCLDNLGEIVLKKSIEILFLHRGIYALATSFCEFYTEIKEDIFFILKPNCISEIKDSFSVEYNDKNMFKYNFQILNNYDLIYKKIKFKLNILKDFINAKNICEEKKKKNYTQENYVNIFINVIKKLEKKMDGPKIIRRAIILIMNELREQILEYFYNMLDERTDEAFKVFEILRKHINTTGVGEVKGIWMYFGEVRRICCEIKIYKECFEIVTDFELEEVIKCIGNEYNNYLKKISKEKISGNICRGNEDIKTYKEDLEEIFKSEIFRILVERKIKEFEIIIIEEIQQILEVLIKYRSFYDSDIFMEKTQKKRIEFLEQVCEYLYSKLRINQEDDYYELVLAINYSKKILEFYEDSILVNSMKDTIKNAEEWIDKYILELDICIGELYILERVEKCIFLNSISENIYIDSLKKNETSDKLDYNFYKLNIINNLNIDYSLDKSDYSKENLYTFDNYKINNLDILFKKIEILNKMNQYVCSDKIRNYILESNILEKKYIKIKKIYNDYIELCHCGIRSYVVELFFKYMINVKWKDCNLNFELLNSKLEEYKVKWYSFEKKMIFFFDIELPKYFREALNFSNQIKEQNKNESNIENKNKSSLKVKKIFIFNDKPEFFMNFFINLNFDHDFIIANINRVMNRIKSIFCDIMIEKLQNGEEYVKYSVVLDNESIYNIEKIKTNFFKEIFAPGINIKGFNKNKELNQLIEEKWNSFLYYFRKVDKNTNISIKSSNNNIKNNKNDIIEDNKVSKIEDEVINRYNNDILSKDNYKSLKFEFKEDNNRSSKKYNILNRWFCNKNEEVKLSEYEYEILNSILNEMNNKDFNNRFKEISKNIEININNYIRNIKFEQIKYFRSALEILTFSIFSKNKIRYFDITIRGLEELEICKKKEFDIFCNVFEKLTDICLRIKDEYSNKILNIFTSISQVLDYIWKQDNKLFDYEIKKANKVFKEIQKKLKISSLLVLQPQDEWRKNIYSKALKICLEYEKAVNKFEISYNIIDLEISKIVEINEECILSEIFLYNFIELFIVELSEGDNNLQNKKCILISLEKLESIFESYKLTRLILRHIMKLKLKNINDISVIRFELLNLIDKNASINIDNISIDINKGLINEELNEIINCSLKVFNNYNIIIKKILFRLEYLNKLNKSSKYYNIEIGMAEYLYYFNLDAAEMAINKQTADDSIILDTLRMVCNKKVIKINKKRLINCIENIEEIEEGILVWLGELDIINKFNDYKLYISELQKIEKILMKDIKIIENIKEIEEVLFEYKNILENKDELYDLSVKQYNDILIVEKEKENENENEKENENENEKEKENEKENENEKEKENENENEKEKVKVKVKENENENENENEKEKEKENEKVKDIKSFDKLSEKIVKNKILDFLCIPISKFRYFSDSMNIEIEKIYKMILLIKKKVKFLLKNIRNRSKKLYFISDRIILQVINNPLLIKSIICDIYNIDNIIIKDEYIISIMASTEIIYIEKAINIKQSVEIVIEEFDKSLKDTLCNYFNCQITKTNCKNIKIKIIDELFEEYQCFNKGLKYGWNKQWYNNITEKMKKIFNVLFKDKDKFDSTSPIMSIYPKPYFKDKILYIGSFIYQFEYYGPTSFIFTTQTAHLFSAIFINLNRPGIVIYGNSGSGKTETIKYFCRTIGIALYTFCCSENVSLKTLQNIIIGCSQMNCYICFDEFNRLTEKVMSSLTEYIIKNQDHIKIFCTMNLGYSGRNNLPKSLQGLFGMIRMDNPDIREIILKITGNIQLFDILSELSIKCLKQHHYDFGLRAVKAITKSCNFNKSNNCNITDISYQNILRNNLIRFYMACLLDCDKQILIQIIMKYFKYNICNFNYGIDTLLEDTLGMNGIIICVSLQNQFNLSSLFNLLINKITKSTNNLKNTYKYTYNPITLLLTNKNSIFGHFNEQGDWIDSTFIQDLRIVNKPTYFIFNGPIFSEWIEDFNSVFDDTKAISLPTAELIKINPLHKFVFLCNDITNVTSATLTRVFLLYSNNLTDICNFSNDFLKLEDSLKTIEISLLDFNSLKIHLIDTRVAFIIGSYGSGKKIIAQNISKSKFVHVNAAEWGITWSMELFCNFNGDIIFIDCFEQAVLGLTEIIKEYFFINKIGEFTKMTYKIICGIDNNIFNNCKSIDEYFLNYKTSYNKIYHYNNISSDIRNINFNHISFNTINFTNYFQFIYMYNDNILNQIISYSKLFILNNEIIDLLEKYNCNEQLSKLIAIIIVEYNLIRSSVSKFLKLLYPNIEPSAIYFILKFLFGSSTNVLSHLETIYNTKIDSDLVFDSNFKFSHMNINIKLSILLFLLYRKTITDIIIRGPRLSGKRWLCEEAKKYIDFKNINIIAWSDIKSDINKIYNIKPSCNNIITIYLMINPISKIIAEDGIEIVIEPNIYEIDPVSYLKYLETNNLNNSCNNYTDKNFCNNYTSSNINMLPLECDYIHPETCFHKSMIFDSFYKYMDFQKSLHKVYLLNYEAAQIRRDFLRCGLENLRQFRKHADTLSYEINEKNSCLRDKMIQISQVISRLRTEQQQIECCTEETAAVTNQLQIKISENNAKKVAIFNILQGVESLLCESREAVSCMSKAHLSEIKSMSSPPIVIKTTIELVYYILERKRKSNWKELLLYVKKDDFISKIMNYLERIRNEGIKVEIMNNNINNKSFIQNFENYDENFLNDFFTTVTFEKANKASRACGALFKWAKACVEFTKVNFQTQPLEAEIKFFESEIKIANASKNEKLKIIESLKESLVQRIQKHDELITEDIVLRDEIILKEKELLQLKTLVTRMNDEYSRWSFYEYKCPIKQLKEYIFNNLFESKKNIFNRNIKNDNLINNTVKKKDKIFIITSLNDKNYIKVIDKALKNNKPVIIMDCNKFDIEVYKLLRRQIENIQSQPVILSGIYENKYFLETYEQDEELFNSTIDNSYLQMAEEELLRLVKNNSEISLISNQKDILEEERKKYEKLKGFKIYSERMNIYYTYINEMFISVYKNKASIHIFKEFLIKKGFIYGNQVKEEEEKYEIDKFYFYSFKFNNIKNNDESFIKTNENLNIKINDIKINKKNYLKSNNFKNIKSNFTIFDINEPKLFYFDYLFFSSFDNIIYNLKKVYNFDIEISAGVLENNLIILNLLEEKSNKLILVKNAHFLPIVINKGSNRFFFIMQTGTLHQLIGSSRVIYYDTEITYNSLYESFKSLFNTDTIIVKWHAFLVSKGYDFSTNDLKVALNHSQLDDEFLLNIIYFNQINFKDHFKLFKEFKLIS